MACGVLLNHEMGVCGQQQLEVSSVHNSQSSCMICRLIHHQVAADWPLHSLC